MASTYTDNNGIEKPGSGEQSGTWGDTTNTNFDIIDRAINGVGSISLSGTTHTLTTSDGTQSEGHYKVLYFTGSPTGTNTVTISPNDQDKIYFVHNDSGQSVTLTQGTGGNVTVADGQTKIVYADGAGAGAKVTDFSSSIDMSSNTTSGVPAGTKQLFVQSTAPTGWTKDTTNNDGSAIRVTTGTASTGGTVDFETAFASQAVAGTIALSGSTASHTLTESQIPSHFHHMFINSAQSGEASVPSAASGVTYRNQYPYQAGSEIFSYFLDGVSGTPSIGRSDVTGGGGGHTHGVGTLAATLTGTAIDLDVKFVDVIVCTKD